jgi:hypothetical protein
VGGEALGGCRPDGHPDDELDSTSEIDEAAVAFSSALLLLRTTSTDEGNQATTDEGDHAPRLLSSSSSGIRARRPP